MSKLYDELNSCGEVRINTGGPKQYRHLTEDEIKEIVLALELVEGVKKLIKQIEEA